MLRTLLRWADIRAGEGTQVLHSTGVLFLLIAAHTAMETARDALFLGELPAHRLAWVYAALAGLAIVVSPLSGSVMRRVGSRAGLMITLMVSAYGGFFFFLAPKSETSVFSLYVYSGLVSTVAVVQFWTLASFSYTVAEGRRLFGPISAGGVLGAVFGASLSLLLLRFFPVDALLLLAVVLYLLAAALVTRIDTADDPARTRGHFPTGEALKRAFASFKKQRYLGSLTLLLGVSTASLLVTDYLFKSVAASTFHPEQLGQFFAVYYAGLNGLALVVQLLVSGYLVRRFGVISAFLVLPILLFGGGVLVVALGAALLVVLLTKAADGALRHSLHRVTSELLWMPLPAEVRSDSKSLIDTVVARGAQAVVAGGLLWLAAEGMDDPRTLAFILCGLLSFWVVVGARLRRPYLALFRNALQTDRRREDFELDLNTVEVVVEALSSREGSRVIAAMDLLSSSGRSRLIPALVLYHESNEVLIAALQIIATSDRSDWIPLAERLLSHEEVSVRIAAMRALARAGVAHAAEERVFDVSPKVRGHASFLVERRSGAGDPLQHPAIQEVLRLEGERGASARVALLESIELAEDTRYADLLLELAQDPSAEVVEAAALAMTKIHDERFIPVLFSRLGTRHGREAVRSALVAHGTHALERLEALLEDPDTDPRIRRHIPGTLSRFGSQRAADVLCRGLGSGLPGLLRFKMLKALGRLVTRVPVRVDRRIISEQLETALLEHLRMGVYAHRMRTDLDSSSESSAAGRAGQMLLQLLGEKAAQALERAFRLLQVLHRHEDVRSLELAVRSADRRVRAQGLEFVDALTLGSTTPSVRELFNVVVDDLSWDERATRVAAALAPLPPRGRATLEHLTQSEDETIALIAVEHASELGMALSSRFQSRGVESSPERASEAELEPLLGRRRRVSPVG